MSVLHFVPCIAPPDFRVVNRKRMIGVVWRDELSACEVAFPLIEYAGIAFRQAALEPAEGAGVWRRNEFFFSAPLSTSKCNSEVGSKDFIR
ncbi:MAG: hypothetical protein AAB489_05665, partial [Patescibacteria group bacterium]